MSRQKYLKNTRLQHTLDGYAADLKAITTIKPKQFDINTVATMISATPSRKWNAAQAVVTATLHKKELEAELKKLKAMKMLEASQATKKGRLSNADDRKAFVDNDVEVQVVEVDLINAEAELTAAKLGYECLDDIFTSGKKIMDWLSEQERATRQYNNFVNEGARQR